MTPAPIRSILEDFPNTALAEAVGPWLLNLDQNEDGLLEKSELQDDQGRLHCDFRTQDLGGARWKKLESILDGRGLVAKRKGGCPMKPGKAPPRLPTASAGLYRSAAFDYVFQLGKGIDLQAVLDFLKDAGYPAQQQKNLYEATLGSGRILRIETSGGTLQKVHYLDAKGDASLLCRLEFWEMLRGAGRFESFFAANPFYDQEREVWQRYYSPVYTYDQTPVLDPDRISKKGWSGVLLVPDLHGDWKRLGALVKLIREQKLDWLALEMLPQNLQNELNDFLSAKLNSATWREAKRKIQNYLQPFWASYFKKTKDPDGNPYYQLLLLCRKRKIQVWALDAPISYTIAADVKFTPLGIGTRNRLWAERVPAKGKGIVYGGEFHFTGFPKVRVQDFLWEKDRKRKVQLLKVGN